MKNYQLLKNKKSQLLITVLLVLAIVLALGAGLLFHSRSFRDVTSLQVDTNQAYSLAESGIDMAERIVAENPSGPAMDETYYNFGEGQIGIAITTASYSIGEDEFLSGTITASGEHERSRCVLTKTFNLKLPLLPDTWAKAYGTAESEQAYCLRQTSDQGFILGGRGDDYLGASSGDDPLVIKTKADGTVDWAMAYGFNGSIEEINSLQQISGGYVLAGYAVPTSGTTDFMVIRTDSEGKVGAVYQDTWATAYGGTGADKIEESDCLQVMSGGYIFGGSTGSDFSGDASPPNFLVIKTDTTGGVDWAGCYGGANEDNLYVLRQAPLGGYILGGETDSFGEGSKDFFLIKITDVGVKDWGKVYGTEQSDSLRCILPIPDGSGYFLGGISQTSLGFGSEDMMLIKTDSSGEPTWAKLYGGTTIDTIRFMEPAPDGSGGLILGGWTNSFGLGGVGMNFLLIKTDSQGRVGAAYPNTWAVAYGGIWTDPFYSLAVTTDNYFLAGYTNSSGSGGYDFFLIKTDSSGDVATCSIVEDVTDEINFVDITTNPGFVDDVPAPASKFKTPLVTGEITPVNLLNDANFSSNSATVSESIVCPE